MGLTPDVGSLFVPVTPEALAWFESVQLCRTARACGGSWWRLSFLAVPQGPRLSSLPAILAKWQLLLN